VRPRLIDVRSGALKALRAEHDHTIAIGMRATLLAQPRASCA
jgi:hypothetical protein